MILQNRLKLIVISKTVPFYISTYIYFFFTYSFFLVLLKPSGLFAKEINCKRNKSNLVELCISISGEIEFIPWYSQIAIYSAGKLDLRFFLQINPPSFFSLALTKYLPYAKLTKLPTYYLSIILLVMIGPKPFWSCFYVFYTKLEIFTKCKLPKLQSDD